MFKGESSLSCSHHEPSGLSFMAQIWRTVSWRKTTFNGRQQQDTVLNQTACKNNNGFILKWFSHFIFYLSKQLPNKFVGAITNLSLRQRSMMVILIMSHLEVNRCESRFGLVIDKTCQSGWRCRSVALSTFKQLLTCFRVLSVFFIVKLWHSHFVLSVHQS